MKCLKKVLISFILFFSLFTIFLGKVSAKEVNVYMFYGKTCPHCEEALKYLESIKNKYDLNIIKYEVWENKENRKIMDEVADVVDINVSGVPFCVIDNTGIIGYSVGVTDETYRYHILKASKEDFTDNVGIKLGLINEEYNYQSSNKESKNFIVKVPFLGKIDLKSISLPIVSIILGIVDGFNPCAMWILLFLISTLLGMKDKKRLWILGITFLVSSALVYLAFMVSWLSFAKMLSGVVLVRLIIALVALTGGVININSYLKTLNSDDGCNVVDAKKRKKIFSKIKKFTHEKSFVLAFFGIILLAVSVNLIELACSAGLPVIFTSLLAMNDLSTFKYILYIGIYILFFMLDDLVIFAVSVKAMELTGISTKYSKYSHLIGGILMFIIGVFLIMKPEWLMFNF